MNKNDSIGDAASHACVPVPRKALVLRASAAVLLATTALSAPGWAFAQQPQPTPPPVGGAAPQSPVTVVQRIIVRGNERIEDTTVLSYLPIQPGQRVTEADVDAGLKSLTGTNLFSSVTITFDPARPGDMIVEVIENPIVNRVLFVGNSALKTDKLRDEVTVRPRGIFTRTRVQQDVQRIIELYRRSGRISATITPKLVELPQKRVDLIFEIDEGPKSGVLDVNFIGNQIFSDKDLQDVIVTERSQWWKFFSSNDNYDPDRIEYDQEQLRDFYRNKGYFDFRVVASVAELAADKNSFAVTFTIDEGKRYRFGKLTVDAKSKRLDGAFLTRLLPIREGQIYQDTAIEGARDALTFAAGTAGFAFVDIIPRYSANPDTQTVDVTFEVDEGPRVYVERIDIVGNTATIDPVIRRELDLAEGDAYNRVLVERSRNRIRQLEFFKDVKIEEQAGSALDKTVLLVTVEEQPTGELAFSAGYSSVDQLVVDLSVTQRNFRGRGQNFRARIATGSFRQQIDFSFTEPRFQGRNLSAGVDLYSYRYDFREQAGYETLSTGLGVRFGFPLSTNASIGLRYTLRSDDIQVSASTCSSSPVLCSQTGSRITSLAGYTWAMDRRNDPINPTRGFTTRASQEVAGLGGDVKYVRTEVEGNWYYGITPRFVVTATGEAGYVESYGGERIRINDRFFKGGNTFRGFETAGIGPRDTRQGDALGGKLYAIGSLEMTVPTFLPDQYGIKGAIFTEVGTLGLLDNRDKIACNTATPQTCSFQTNIRDDLSLRASVGVSVFWRSPLGPIRLDFSKVLAKEDYDKTESFRFSTTARF
jgi:outer membrane protein insertion porin family